MLYYRYFGGIKLGTGGLVRAYGGVALECLKGAPTCYVKPKVFFEPCIVVSIIPSFLFILYI